MGSSIRRASAAVLFAALVACDPDGADDPPCANQACSDERVLVPVYPIAGLYVIDDLPGTTEQPMPTESRLVDGDLTTSAGVNLGPGGTSFQNLGLDMGSSVSVEQLRIHVRDGSGLTLDSGGAVAWTPYSSNDGTQWALVDGAMASFREELSAYVFGFAPTTARFFKAVSFGVNTAETFVTELEAFTRSDPPCPCTQ